uniref:XPG N-terminal domain-containing protein n=1 Tax=Aegilops tauschii TaxID=37682 RepID=N1R1G2_AEGTA
MGIKLLAEHAPRAAVQRRVEDYRGRVIAIDASLSIYQFLVEDGVAEPAGRRDGRWILIQGGG